MKRMTGDDFNDFRLGIMDVGDKIRKVRKRLEKFEDQEGLIHFLNQLDQLTVACLSYGHLKLVNADKTKLIEELSFNEKMRESQ